MAHGGALASSELAGRTGTTERDIRDRLLNQAAGGYVDYEPAIGTDPVPNEHTMAPSEGKSPFVIGKGFQVVPAMVKAEPPICRPFMPSEGMFWGEHDHNLFEGTERFLCPMSELRGPSCRAAGSRAPDGVKARLERGAVVADVGYGQEASTILRCRRTCTLASSDNR